MRSVLRRVLWSGLARRGGKKKKGGGPAVEVAQSDDIVNIFKDRKDPEIYPNEAYPPWLFELLRAQPYSFRDRQYQMYHGRFYPEEREAYSFSKSGQRLRMKMRNDRHIKQGYATSSDDEIAPYVGMRDQQENQEGEGGEGGVDMDDMDDGGAAGDIEEEEAAPKKKKK